MGVLQEAGQGNALAFATGQQHPFAHKGVIAWEASQ
jgi:hypothetical protein